MIEQMRERPSGATGSLVGSWEWLYHMPGSLNCISLILQRARLRHTLRRSWMQRDQESVDPVIVQQNAKAISLRLSKTATARCFHWSFPHNITTRSR